MGEMVYTFKRSFAEYHRGRAQDVGERLEAIRRENDGTLNAVDVVVDARANESPLHEFFEWNDGKAARQHRLDQAKQLIKAVSVVVPDSDGAERPAFRAAAADPAADDGKPKFVRADKAPAFTMPVKSRGDRLLEAYRELRKFRSRYAQLDELGPLLRAIDEELREIEHQGELAGDARFADDEGEEASDVG